MDLNYFNYLMPNGNQIRMGVETDPYGLPVANHLWKRHPAEYSTAPQFRIRVPAAEIVHLFTRSASGRPARLSRDVAVDDSGARSCRITGYTEVSLNMSVLPTTHYFLASILLSRYLPDVSNG
jgi:hypothetical protein